MRRVVLAASVLAFLGTLAPPVFAQAPTPKVTINGFMQQVTSWKKNVSLVDGTVGRDGDELWYARTRLRMDPTAQVGKVKATWRFEFDHSYGRTGATDATAPNVTGTTGSLDLGTDVVGTIESTWFYIETPVTGEGSLLPFIPVPTVGRFGAQPIYGIHHPKTAIYASGDFAGIHLITTVSPAILNRLTYVQVEEAGSGARDGFVNGDDFGVIWSLQVTPVKGVDIRPMVAYLFLDGAMTSGSRAARGGISAAAHPRGVTEDRVTLGVDADWRQGPFSLSPTVYYQTGTRETRLTAAETAIGEGPAGTRRVADINAWLIDVRAGYRLGPLLVEPMVMWTSGNRAQDKLSRNVNFYQPQQTDTTYYSGWANIFALDVDFNQLGTVSGNFGGSIGYDRYGRVQFGTRVFYDVTPAFTPWFKGTVAWTDKSVDTDAVRLNGLSSRPALGRPEGDSRYLGTEIDVGFTWKFAPAIFFEAVYGYLAAGPALGSAYQTVIGAPQSNQDSKVRDVQIFSARMNYTF